MDSLPVIDEVLRTPEERFATVPDFPYRPRYVEVGGLRIAYVDEGPAGAAPVLPMHGELTADACAAVTRCATAATLLAGWSAPGCAFAQPGLRHSRRRALRSPGRTCCDPGLPAVAASALLLNDAS